MELTKSEAVAFIRQRADIFDGQSNPFMRSEWLLHFIEHIVEPGWKILTLEHADGFDYSVALFYRDTLGRVRPLTNYYASLYSVVSTADPRSDIMDGIVRQLKCSTLMLGPVEDDQSTRLLQQSFNENGWMTYRYFTHGNRYMPGIPWAEYLAGRDSQLRNTIKRKGKSFPGELRIVTDPADVDAAMDGYERVYSQSWQGKAQAESHPEFIRGWARICAENGWLRLGIATLNGQAIAAAFWFVVDGKALIYKLAFDEAHSKLSAGTLLTAMLMERALDVDKVSEVDYLTGDDDYKASWMPLRRERLGLAAFNRRTVVGAARATYEYAKLLVKQ
jgi:hypothetical protein